MIRAKVDPGICKFVTVVDVKKLPDRELEIKIYSGCPNLDAFSQTLAKIKAMDAMNFPRGNLLLEKASEKYLM